MPAELTRILVIKLGALGDFVLATGAFRAIRAHHPDAELTLLTTPTFAAMARACGWFDRVETVARPSKWNWPALWRLSRAIAGRGYRRVYDLQRNDITARLFRLLPRPRPEWNGIASGCSHPHLDPAQHDIHTLERQKGHLAAAGITEVPDTDLGWLDGDISGFGLSGPHALLVPGGSRARPQKRWPVERYVELARRLADDGLRPMLIGGPDEADALARIAAGEPGALDLCGRTSFGQIAALARTARLAVGNDTGPVHIVAGVGCDCAVLFGGDSDPGLTAPRGVAGGRVAILRRAPLADLTVDEVWDALERAGFGLAEPV